MKKHVLSALILSFSMCQGINVYASDNTAVNKSNTEVTLTVPRENTEKATDEEVTELNKNFLHLREIGDAKSRELEMKASDLLWSGERNRDTILSMTEKIKEEIKRIENQLPGEGTSDNGVPMATEDAIAKLHSSLTELSAVGDEKSRAIEKEIYEFLSRDEREMTEKAVYKRIQLIDKEIDRIKNTPVSTTSDMLTVTPETLRELQEAIGDLIVLDKSLTDEAIVDVGFDLLKTNSQSLVKEESVRGVIKLIRDEIERVTFLSQDPYGKEATPESIKSLSGLLEILRIKKNYNKELEETALLLISKGTETPLTEGAVSKISEEIESEIKRIDRKETEESNKPTPRDSVKIEVTAENKVTDTLTVPESTREISSETYSEKEKDVYRNQEALPDAGAVSLPWLSLSGIISLISGTSILIFRKKNDRQM